MQSASLSNVMDSMWTLYLDFYLLPITCDSSDVCCSLFCTAYLQKSPTHLAEIYQKDSQATQMACKIKDCSEETLCVIDRKY